MYRDDINKEFTKYYPLDNSCFDLLFENFTMLTFKKGSVIIEADKLSGDMFFIESGIIRMFYIDADGNEVTQCFGVQGDFFASMHSYYNNEPAFISVEALSEIVVYSISHDTIEELCSSNVQIANWMRKVCLEQLFCLEKRCKVFGKEEAISRYVKLIKTRPQIVKEVSLKHIASYLGITQQSLSRIRAKLSTRK